MKFRTGQTVYIANDTNDGILSGVVVEDHGDGRVGVVGFAAHLGMMALSYTEDSLAASPDEVLPHSRSKDPNACHYCGQPATSTGFFNESVCEQCGG